MYSGLLPRRYKDHRRYSFHRTFGSTTALRDCEFDFQSWNPNQNDTDTVFNNPPYIDGCTYYTRADIAANEDNILYNPAFTGEKTCLIEGVPMGGACSLESSFKSGIVYGLQALGETTDAQALAHRRGPYFEVDLVPGLDWFDSFWSALQTGQKCLSVGTPWFPEMTGFSTVDTVSVRPTQMWHNWEACGVKTTDQPRLKIKAWTGEYVYLSRSVVNALMSVKGTDALADSHGKATPQDIQTVRMNIIELLISLYQRLLASAKTVGGVSPSESLYDQFEDEIHYIQEEINEYTMPQFKPMIIKWANAIALEEGAAAGSNNPGNLKLSTLTESWGGTKGRAATDGGFLCHFSTPQQGMSALCNFLTLGAENELLAFHQARTLREFTVVFAGNPPEGYIEGIIAHLGVPGDTLISTFIQ